MPSQCHPPHTLYLSTLKCSGWWPPSRTLSCVHTRTYAHAPPLSVGVWSRSLLGTSPPRSKQASPLLGPKTLLSQQDSGFPKASLGAGLVPPTLGEASSLFSCLHQPRPRRPPPRARTRTHAQTDRFSEMRSQTRDSRTGLTCPVSLRENLFYRPGHEYLAGQQ